MTESHHPPTGQRDGSQETGPTRPPGRNTRRLTVGLCAAVALGVVAGVGIWSLTSGSSGAGPDMEPTLVNGYRYEVPQTDVDPDHVFEFDAAYDLDTMQTQINGEGGDSQGVFEVYTDPGLTHHADFHVSQMGDTVRVEPEEAVEASLAVNDSNSAEEEAARRIRPDAEGMVQGGSWYLYDTYYLVQYLDEKGEELAHPEVTQFSVETDRLDTTSPQISTANEYGDVELSWDPVDSAEDYLVVVSSWDTERSTRTYTVVDETSDTTWSSENSRATRDGDVVTQNLGLSFFATSADASEHANEKDIDIIWDPAEIELGVIAVNSSSMSAYGAVDAADQLTSLPNELALDTALKRFPSDSRSSLTDLPTSVPYTSLDGATREAAARIDAESIDKRILSTKHEDGSITDQAVYEMEVRGLGTDLSVPVTLKTDSESGAEKAIEKFNARAIADAPKTGTVSASPVSSLEEFEGLDPSTEAPETSVTPQGTNELTRYLAANLLDRQSAIDISDFTGKPGMPEATDAVEEALYQNPYVVGIADYSIRQNIVYVKYSLSKEEFTETQQQVQEKVSDVIDSVVDDGMDEREIATAINDWITDNTEYDYEAFERGNLDPVEYEDSYSVTGALLEGKGVCASYADAFNILTTEAGLDSVTVTGLVADGGPHAWNKVKISDEWLAVDSTWNDNEPANRYLLITDGDFTDGAERSEDKAWVADASLPSFQTP